MVCTSNLHLTGGTAFDLPYAYNSKNYNSRTEVVVELAFRHSLPFVAQAYCFCEQYEWHFLCTFVHLHTHNYTQID